MGAEIEIHWLLSLGEQTRDVTFLQASATNGNISAQVHNLAVAPTGSHQHISGKIRAQNSSHGHEKS